MMSLIVIALIITVGVLLVAAFRILGAVFGFIIDMYFDENPFLGFIVIVSCICGLIYWWMH